MTTIRMRLTLWYAGLFLVSGVVLVALVYTLLSHAFLVTDRGFADRVAQRAGVPVQRPAQTPSAGVPQLPPPPEVRFRLRAGDPERAVALATVLEQSRTAARSEALRELLVQSSIALGAMAALSLAAGWLIAGRMLRPVVAITDTVRRINAEHLDERVALAGPHDELKHLADQFDAMLDRLDEAFQAQREFVANASHELRTPLAVMRTELEVALADPDVSAAELRESAAVVQRAIARSEALVTALLTLARADAPLTAAARVALDEVTQAAITAQQSRIDARGLTVRDTHAPATVRGDATLLDRMVANLIENAIAYNRDGGWIEVETHAVDHTVTLRVANAGAEIDPAAVGGLFERFRRLDDSRARADGGHGLGMAIVRAVARHHSGDATAEALPGGGLAVTVTLPAAT